MRLKRNIKILKSLKNKIPQANKSFQTPKERVISLLERISENRPSEMKKLIKLDKYKRKSYIFQIRTREEKLDFNYNYITKEMNEHEQKMYHKINIFKKVMKKFEDSEIKNFKQFKECKKDNDLFSKMFKDFKKNKNVKEAENSFFFDVMNKYALRKIRLPNITTNVFTLNPLITNNSNVKELFEHNKIDGDKFLNYIGKIKEMVKRKIDGKTSLDEEEKKHLEEIIKNEKPKGYIPPEILIPKLQEDISKIQNAFDYIENETKSETIPVEKPKINLKLLNKEHFYEVKKLNLNNKKRVSFPININDINNINNNNNDKKELKEIDNNINNNINNENNKEILIYLIKYKRRKFSRNKF